ncbi:MAG: cell division protein SepF [Lachnospiraceae bacterium]|nr:cell division protein SepF [Lachnospiraceae bacterium]
MGILDGFLNSIKINEYDDDDDEDFRDDDLDDLDLYDDEDEEEEEERAPKPRGRFFSRFGASGRDEDEEDDYLDDEPEEDDLRPARESLTSHRSKSYSAPAPEKERSAPPKRPERKREPVREAREPRETREPKPARRFGSDRKEKKSKITPIRNKKSSFLGMGVIVVRPSSMEEVRSIADHLVEGTTLVINLEGLDLATGQRIMDFICGVCYSLNGSLQKISGYIYILAPDGVDISGDYETIASAAVNLSSMDSSY